VAAVPEDAGGKRLDGIVRSVFGLSWSDAREAIRSGKVFLGDPGSVETDAERPMRAGTRLELRPAAPRPHVARLGTFERGAIEFLDRHVVVVEKPAGISTVPFGEEPSDEETLDAVVREVLARRLDRMGAARGRAPLGVVHRLDKETSGLIVFTRTVEAKKHLANQFRHHTTHRRYVALVNGELRQKRTFRSYLVDDRGDGLRGSAREGRREGRLAITHVEPLEQLGGATLVSCRLETGRTHQIRIHLSEAGHPLVGERVYVRRYAGEPLPAPRLMLHAIELGFEHPVSEEQMFFERIPPEDFQSVLTSLRARKTLATQARAAEIEAASRVEEVTVQQVESPKETSAPQSARAPRENARPASARSPRSPRPARTKR
jgi:23S rRNA pseudouridine1911/1915/1917 synthase